MGYVYALQFDDLSIKVGQAGDADKRIARHKAEAARFGRRVVQIWSASVPRPSATEGRLIDYCLSHGTARPGTREYFTGVPWDSEAWDKVSRGTPPPWDRPCPTEEWDNEEWDRELSHRYEEIVGQHRLGQTGVPWDSRCPWIACPTNTHAIIWDEECPSRDLCHQIRKINET
jgi:hypothetical protein